MAEFQEVISGEGIDFNTQLFEAIKANNHSQISVLVAKGASIGAKEGTKTPLQLAVR